MTPAHYRDRFIDGLGFGPDQFQLDAIDAIDEHVNVLVSAPTGSGKTLIANYAIGRILERGERAFYTTPLKALSNQKFKELSDSTVSTGSDCSPGTRRSIATPTSS